MPLQLYTQEQLRTILSQYPGQRLLFIGQCFCGADPQHYVEVLRPFGIPVTVHTLDVEQREYAYLVPEEVDIVTVRRMFFPMY